MRPNQSHRIWCLEIRRCRDLSSEDGGGQLKVVIAPAIDLFLDRYGNLAHVLASPWRIINTIRIELKNTVSGHHQVNFAITKSLKRRKRVVPRVAPGSSPINDKVINNSAETDQSGVIIGFLTKKYSSSYMLRTRSLQKRAIIKILSIEQPNKEHERIRELWQPSSSPDPRPMQNQSSRRLHE